VQNVRPVAVAQVGAGVGVGDGGAAAWMRMDEQANQLLLDRTCSVHRPSAAVQVTDGTLTVNVYVLTAVGVAPDWMVTGVVKFVLPAGAMRIVSGPVPSPATTCHTTIACLEQKSTREKCHKNKTKI
jgi:hypothetical protein